MVLLGIPCGSVTPQMISKRLSEVKPKDAIRAPPRPAWGADVISSNVVGYNKVDLNRGYNMLAVQFNEVGGGAQNIQDIFTGNLPDMSVDEEGYPVWNAKLQTWNGVGYDNFYWTGSVGGELFEDSSYNNVWVVGQYGDSVANVNIGVGEPFFIWLRSGSNVTATFTK